jgi:hypothetical protein
MRLETKWRLFCLPVVDGTESIELKITSSAHAFENKMAAVLSACSRWDRGRGTSPGLQCPIWKGSLAGLCVMTCCTKLPL